MRQTGCLCSARQTVTRKSRKCILRKNWLRDIIEYWAKVTLIFFTHQDMVLGYLTLYFRLDICPNRDAIFGARIVLYRLAGIDLKQTKEILLSDATLAIN